MAQTHTRRSLFRLCGRLSLRRPQCQRRGICVDRSLPLMRKTFIEATQPRTITRPHQSLFRLCGRLSLRRRHWQLLDECRAESLPLMRKTFIEARTLAASCTHQCAGLFRLCGRLSLRLSGVHDDAVSSQRVSSAYAEDFH